MCSCIPNGRRKESNNAKWSCVYATILATPIWDPSTHMREEGSMAYQRPSFGLSVESHRSAYAVLMTRGTSLTLLRP